MVLNGLLCLFGLNRFSGGGYYFLRSPGGIKVLNDFQGVINVLFPPRGKKVLNDFKGVINGLSDFRVENRVQK